MLQSLIVGANGQVGAAIASLLGDRALPAGRAITPRTPIALDLIACARNPGLAQTLLAPLALDAVYCVGGATDVERCETDISWAMDTNCNGPAALAAASRHLPFVYFSTDYVFDGNHGPYSETDATNALSVYGRSKLEGEQRVLDAHPDALIIRTTGVFGPDHQRKNFLYTLQRLLSTGQRMKVPGDQISTPTYNVDLAQSTIDLMAARATGIFHAGGPDLLSRFDFALLAADLLHLDPSQLDNIATADLNQRAPRPLFSGLKIDKLTATLGRNPMRSTRDAIAAWAAQETA
jgi:dTDP-4-dehydrorhamnose reductase